jgi:hypothetical protein
VQVVAAELPKYQAEALAALVAVVTAALDWVEMDKTVQPTPEAAAEPEMAPEAQVDLVLLSFGTSANSVVQAELSHQLVVTQSTHLHHLVHLQLKE